VIEAVITPTFEAWLTRASALLTAGVSPSAIAWKAGGTQPALPGLFATDDSPETASAPPRPSARFAALARRVVHHASEQRWHRLYRVLWRPRRPASAGHRDRRRCGGASCHGR
jgi:hypothetical protein